MERTRLRNAFTLIELLVVIGIIALLISILLPALAAARKAAQQAACMSNMRQWGMALQAYVDQNKNMLPQKGPDGSSTAQSFGPFTNGNNVTGFDDPSLWFNGLPPLMNQTGYSDMVYSYLTQGGLLPHVGGGASMWVCPSANPPAYIESGAHNDTIWQGGSGLPAESENNFYELYGASSNNILIGGKVKLSEFPFYSSYVFNSKLTNIYNPVTTGTAVPNIINMSQLAPSSEVVTMSEKLSFAGEDMDPVVQQWWPTVPSWVQGNSKLNKYGYTSNVAQPKGDWTRFTCRHNHGGHLLFADGHVQWFQWTEVQISAQEIARGQTAADWNQYGKIVWSALGPTQ